jgi:hypothetical protein
MDKSRERRKRLMCSLAWRIRVVNGIKSCHTNIVTAIVSFRVVQVRGKPKTGGLI